MESFVLIVVCLYIWTTLGCLALNSMDNTDDWILPESRTILPPADGRLHLYVLPVGMGDTQVIQCPDGDLTLVDSGSFNVGESRFLGPEEIKNWLTGHEEHLRNIVISHYHSDHNRFLPQIFTDISMLPALSNIFISCRGEDSPDLVKNWFDELQLWDKVITFNNGDPCGPNGIECGDMPLCPNSPDVRTPVLSANLGQQCTIGGDTNIAKNMDSIVTKIIYGDVSILLDTDFEDATSDIDEEGPLKMLVDYYGTELISTVFQIAHHGDDFWANKPILQDAVRPKAVYRYVSSNPWYIIGYPRCSVFDGFIDDVGTLCKPGETDVSSEFYCGPLLDDENLPSTQDTYACAVGSSINISIRTENEYAIYTTTPDNDTINLLTFFTDGQAWGFHTNVTYRAQTKY